MTWRSLPPIALLLCACATTRNDSALAPAPAPDCSFRAATTCWTLGARVPTRAHEARDSAPERLLAQPPAVLASRRDTAAVR